MTNNDALQNNAGYHADRTHLSSSILKLLLTDTNAFYEKWVLNLPEPSKQQFIEGTLTHALILEGDEVAKRYAFYTGLRRVGQHFEDWKAKQGADKELLLISTKLRADANYKAYMDRPEAVDLIQNSLKEHNMFGEILGIKVKARADAIDVDRGIIVDVKTTSYPSDTEIFKNTVGEFMYNLSAALYCKIAEQAYGKPFEFYWVTISKSDNQCHVYKASPSTLQTGSALLMKALLLYKNFQASNNSIDALRSTPYTKSTSLYEIVEV